MVSGPSYQRYIKKKNSDWKKPTNNLQIYTVVFSSPAVVLLVFLWANLHKYYGCCFFVASNCQLRNEENAALLGHSLLSGFLIAELSPCPQKRKTSGPFFSFLALLRSGKRSAPCLTTDKRFTFLALRSFLSLKYFLFPHPYESVSRWSHSLFIWWGPVGPVRGLDW